METKESHDIVRKVFERPKNADDKAPSLFVSKQGAPAAAAPKKISRHLLSSRLAPAAVDIGTSGIRLLQVIRNPQGTLEVSKFDEEFYDVSSRPASSDEQRTSLLKLLERNRDVRQVVTGFSGRQVQIYHLVFPPTSDGELSRVVEWKLRQLKPFGLGAEGVRFGWRRLEEKTAGGIKPIQIKVLIVCVPGEVVDRRLALLNAAGVTPAALEVLPLSLVNLSRFFAGSFHKEETVLWLDLGADESVLTVEKGGQVHFFKSLTTTSRQLTSQIAQIRRVSENEAESLKREHGLSFWSSDLKGSVPSASETPAAAVYQALISSLEGLVVDIEHSFNYFSYQITQSQIPRFDRLMLSGGGADLKNLDFFLSARLGVPVQKVTPFAAVKISEAVGNKKKLLSESASGYASVAALAAVPMLKASERIDLLPRKPKPWDASIRGLRKKPRRAAILVAAVLLALLAPPLGQLAYYQAQAAAVLREVSHLQLEVKDQQTVEFELADREADLVKKNRILEARLGLLENARRDGGRVSALLEELARSLPEEIWITKLSYRGGNFFVTGASANAAAVVDFMEKLKTAKGFQNPVFKYTEKKETREPFYTFEVSADAP